MKNAMKRLDVVANILVICVCVAALILLANKYLNAGSPTPEISESPTPGTRVAVPGLDDSASETLVLVLDKSCPFCRQSAPFYKRLATSPNHNNVRLVVAMDDPESEIRRYLDRLSVPIADIATIDDIYDTMKVTRVPTLLLIREGIVRRSWVGTLSSEREGEVLALFHNNRSAVDKGAIQ
jgi:thiol-disulfide isomerase/thioredoxin